MREPGAADEMPVATEEEAAKMQKDAEVIEKDVDGARKMVDKVNSFEEGGPQTVASLLQQFGEIGNADEIGEADDRDMANTIKGILFVLLVLLVFNSISVFSFG